MAMTYAAFGKLTCSVLLMAFAVVLFLVLWVGACAGSAAIFGQENDVIILIGVAGALVGIAVCLPMLLKGGRLFCEAVREAVYPT